jgi:hypothetical protein
MSRKFRRLAILAKRETNYGTDSVPLGTTDAMLARNVSITPLAGEDVRRDLILPHLGNQGILLSGDHARVEFEIEIAGAGAAGTVPRYGALLRACGLSETITVGTSVAYAPVSQSEEAASIYWFHDGVRHILLGSRGTVTFDFTVKQIPVMRFQMTGLLGTITDQALPAVTVTAFQRPVIVSNANTTLQLHGAAAIAERIMVDLGNTIEPRFMIGEETIELTDRQSRGEVVVEAQSIAARNWFGIAQQRTRGGFALTHGTVAGNRFDIAGPAVEIGRPSQGQAQGILNYTLPLMFCPSTGNDELVLTVR